MWKSGRWRMLARAAALAAPLVVAGAAGDSSADDGPRPFHIKADRVLVEKGKRQLSLLLGGSVIYRAAIALGPEPQGHKLRAGDGRTPEGLYALDYFNENSEFYKSIHISYPNGVDRLRAASRGEAPGGGIAIHGLPPGQEWIAEFQGRSDWTSGCIGVSNEAMDVIWASVELGTPIEIRR